MRRLLELFLDRSKDAGDLFGRALSISVESAHSVIDRNVELDAPVEQVVQLVGARHVDFVRIVHFILAAEPSIAIQDQTNVAGTGNARTWRSRRCS